MEELIKSKIKLILLMMCTIFMAMGLTTKVHAQEAVTGTVYDITTTTVNQTDGSISVSQADGITYVTLNNNVFGMLRFVESGTYVLNANGHTIYPDVGKNAHAIFCQGPDSNLESITVNLTLKGDGTYYSGYTHIVCLEGTGSTLNIESGAFWRYNNSTKSRFDIADGNVNFTIAEGNGGVQIQSGMTPNAHKVNVKVTCWDLNDIVVKQFAQDENGAELLNPFQAPTPPTPPTTTPEGGTTPPEGGTTSPSGGTSPNGDTAANLSGEIIPVFGNMTEVVIELTEGQKYVKDVLSQLETVVEDGTVIINTKDWCCFNRTLAEKIANKKDVAVTIQYLYQGKKYEVTIPAGTDIISLLDENGFVGFRYLDSVFGGREITE